MAKQVRAFKSDDGRTYDILEECIVGDLQHFLETVSGDEADLDSLTARYIVDNADRIKTILNQLVLEPEEEH